MKEPEMKYHCLPCDRDFQTRGGLSDHNVKKHKIRQRAKRVSIEATPRTKKRVSTACYRERKANAKRTLKKRTVASQTIVSMHDLHWTEPCIILRKY